MVDEPLLNIDEACMFLGIKKSTLYHYSSGETPKIPVIRISRKMIRFSPTALRAWIEARSQGEGSK